MSRARQRLRIGPGFGGKIVATIFTVIFLFLFGTVFSAFALPSVPILPELFGWFDQGERQHLVQEVGPVVRLVVAAFAGLAVALLVAGLWYVLRYACFLDGTVVTVRRALSTQTVDIARAVRFWFDESKERTREERGFYEYDTTYIVPQLCTRGPGGVVKIPLAYHGSRLPPAQLDALARAIASGGPRSGPYGDEARRAVDALRRFARSIPGEHFNLVAWRTRRSRSD